MKTTLDLEDVVYDQLKSGTLITIITGVLRKGDRPVSSEKEDVTVNSLPVTSQQLQSAIVNVNVFVPDLEIVEEGKVSFEKDHARLLVLTNQAITELKDKIKGEYTWDIQQQNVFKDNESQSHYVNIRLQFYVSNI